MNEPDLTQVEQEVAHTAALILAAEALAERMAQRPTSPTLPDNLRRLQDAVERSRERLLQVTAAEQQEQTASS